MLDTNIRKQTHIA